MANFNRQRTLVAIVQDVAGQLGLPVPMQVIGNVLDASAVQMGTLLNYCGRRLIKPTSGNRWQVLSRTWQFSTVPGQTLYTLPDDFDSFIDSTGWNETTRLPMLGPALEQQWAVLKGRGLGPSTVSVVYRTRGGKFEMFDSPMTPQNLSLAYSSRAWVLDSDGLTYKDSMTSDGDLCLFDADMITSYLKLRFLIEKGFDSSAALADFQAAQEQAQNADQDAPTLSTAGPACFPFINPIYNLPESGFGP